MRWKPLQIVGGSYADDSRPWSSQDTVNWLPVMAEKQGTRSPSMLRGVPGLVLFADSGDSSGTRGMHDVEGRLFSVIGSTLYEISTSTGSCSAKGTIPGVSRVSMAHNQVAGGNQLAIANGLSGYVFDTRDNTLAQITDDGFIGSKSFDFVDQYIVGIDPTGRRAFTSDLADAKSYSTLDQYEAESAPDKIVGQIVTHREWWLMGSRTIEPFVDTGAGTGTFQRQSGVVIERGLAATHAVALLDNSVFWLGSDGVVYRANGYTPERISTHAVEQDIARSTLSKAFAFTWEDRGHKVFYLTFQDGKTWGYDVASGEWHRRKSEGIDRWRVSDLVQSNGDWYAGDYASGKIYKLDWNVQHENGFVLERRRSCAVIHDNQNRLIINGLELVVDTGQVSYFGNNSAVHITGDLPDQYLNATVNYSYQVSGGFSPYSVSIIGGSLPTGLVMDTHGTITGTATAAGAYSWTVQVTDGQGQKASLVDTCNVLTASAYGSLASSVNSFNVYSGTTLPAISSGAKPEDITFSPDGSIAYIPNSTTNTLDVYNMATGIKTVSVPCGTSPQGSSLSIDGTRLIVTNNGSNNLTVIDTSSNTAVSTVATGTAPIMARTNKVSGDIYVVSEIDGKVYIVNSSGVQQGYFSTTNPRGIRATRDGKYAVVVGYAGLLIFDATSHSLIGSINLRGGFGPYDVAISVDDRYAYVIDINYTDMKVVDLIDPTTPIVVADIAGVGKGFRCEIAGTGDRLIAGVADGMQVVDTTTNTLLNKISSSQVYSVAIRYSIS